jgi:hypothetical protein
MNLTRTSSAFEFPTIRVFHPQIPHGKSASYCGVKEGIDYTVEKSRRLLASEEEATLTPQTTL